MIQASPFSSIRSEFPLLSSDKAPVYFDSAATTQKPLSVIRRLSDFYSQEYATVHRGVYEASQIATDRYEASRRTIADFFQVTAKEIIFTRGTTESINLVARAYGAKNCIAEDNIVLSEIEHHSNIVPWQMLRDEIGLELRVIPVDDHGDLRLEEAERLIDSRTKLLALTHVSNAIGTLVPVEKLIQLAKKYNVPTLIDGAQAAAHMPVALKKLGCDFYCFSAHKMYGPTGIGGLFISSNIQKQMGVYQTGGGMVERVSFDKTTFVQGPYKFEAGTPAIAEAIGFEAAIQYLEKIGMDQIQLHEADLLRFSVEQLSTVSSVKIIGNPAQRASVISFVMEGVHPHDLGTVLDHENIWVRAGHHCAQPTMKRFNVGATTRISLGIYNTEQDVLKLIQALKKAESVLL